MCCLHFKHQEKLLRRHGLETQTICLVSSAKHNREKAILHPSAVFCDSIPVCYLNNKRCTYQSAHLLLNITPIPVQA